MTRRVGVGGWDWEVVVREREKETEGETQGGGWGERGEWETRKEHTEYSSHNSNEPLSKKP